MRRHLFALVAAATLAAAGASAAAPVEGLWHTPENNGQVRITDNAGFLSGAIVTSDRIKGDPGLADVRNKDANLRSRPLKGLTLFEGLSGGPTVWKGKVYNPEDGGTYAGSLKVVDANTVKLTGCIVFPLCKTDTWTRLH